MISIEFTLDEEGAWHFFLTVPEGEESPLMPFIANGEPVFQDSYAEWIAFGLEWLARLGGGRIIVFGDG